MANCQFIRSQGISQRGKLLMMLGQCAEAASDFQRVVEYVFRAC